MHFFQQVSQPCRWCSARCPPGQECNNVSGLSSPAEWSSVLSMILCLSFSCGFRSESCIEKWFHASFSVSGLLSYRALNSNLFKTWQEPMSPGGWSVPPPLFAWPGIHEKKRSCFKLFVVVHAGLSNPCRSSLRAFQPKTPHGFANPTILDHDQHSILLQGFLLQLGSVGLSKPNAPQPNGPGGIPAQGPDASPPPPLHDFGKFRHKSGSVSPWSSKLTPVHVRNIAARSENSR